MLNRLVNKVKKIIYKLASATPVLFPANRVLIVKLDAIGDYVLFRNGLEYIVKCDRFRNHTFYLLGNHLWRDLSESLDKDFIKDFIWIKPSVIYNRHENKFARSLLLLKLKFLRFNTVINPVHSRLLDIDCFINDLGSKNRIASSGDEINYIPGEKKIGDKCYTEIINVSDHSHFEFYRNSEFVQGLTGISPKNILLQIKSGIKNILDLNIVIAPGAGHARRQWPATHFASTMMIINKNLKGLKFIICGSAVDSVKAKDILSHYKYENAYDYTGTQSLLEYTNLLHNSILLISNESSAVHLAAAIDLPSLCISNGNMFGRFNPYPPEMNKNIITIYSDSKFYDPRQFTENVEKYKVKSELDISIIEPLVVAEACIETINLSLNKVIND